MRVQPAVVGLMAIAAAAIVAAAPTANPLRITNLPVFDACNMAHWGGLGDVENLMTADFNFNPDALPCDESIQGFVSVTLANMTEDATCTKPKPGNIAAQGAGTYQIWQRAAEIKNPDGTWRRGCLPKAIIAATGQARVCGDQEQIRDRTQSGFMTVDGTTYEWRTGDNSEHSMQVTLQYHPDGVGIGMADGRCYLNYPFLPGLVITFSYNGPLVLPSFDSCNLAHLAALPGGLDNNQAYCTDNFARTVWHTYSVKPRACEGSSSAWNSLDPLARNLTGVWQTTEYSSVGARSGSTTEQCSGGGAATRQRTVSFCSVQGVQMMSISAAAAENYYAPTGELFTALPDEAHTVPVDVGSISDKHGILRLDVGGGEKFCLLVTRTESDFVVKSSEVLRSSTGGGGGSGTGGTCNVVPNMFMYNGRIVTDQGCPASKCTGETVKINGKTYNVVGDPAALHMKAVDASCAA